MSVPAQVRLAIRAMGFRVVAAIGKVPVLQDWRNRGDAPAEEVSKWRGGNTGVDTRETPACDIDIDHEEAAECVEGLARDWFDDRGILLVRFGKPPRRALLFKTSEPFRKLVTHFVAPNGTRHKIEFLGDGQQIIVDGIHPDTGDRYAWFSDYGPATVNREWLIEITEAEAREFVARAAEVLGEEYGFELLQPAAPPGSEFIARANGQDRDAGDRAGPVDVEEELARIVDGESANAAHTRIIPSMLRKGEHPNDVVNFVVEETVKRVPGWNTAVEERAVRQRVLAGYRLFERDYDPATGSVPDWLPGEFHERWVELLMAGSVPTMHRSLGGYCVKSAWGSKRARAEEPAGEEPSNDAPEAGGPPGPGEQKPKGPRVLVLRPFVAFDPAKLPPRAWLYGSHYQRKTVSLTAGPGGMGKSSLVLVECIAMATARSLLGEQPTERLRVWLHNGEEPREEIDRRIAAICMRYDIPQTELEGQLFITSGAEFPLRVAKGYAELKIDEVLVRQISAEIGANGIDVAAFDPLVTLHSVSEGDPGKMDRVVRIFAGIADEHDAAVELNHHVRKPAAGTDADLDVSDIRGVMAITDAVRAARVLNRMSKSDAENTGLDEVARLSYFRVDRAKGNYSPARAATWRRFANVDLPNGDDVGVVEPWEFPGQGVPTPEKTAADQKAEYVFLQLLDKFLARGTNVNASGGTGYAPPTFAVEKEATTAKVSKAALKAAMNRLLDAGRIKTERTGRNDRESYRIVRGKGL